MASEYTFYPKFSEFVTLFRGVVSVWIGNGDNASPANPDFPSYNNEGILYAQYVNEDVQILGPVTDYNYAVQKGFEGSFSDWVQFMLDTADHVINAERWATGGTGELYTQGNSAKEQADRAAVWVTGNSEGNGSPTNNAKYWSDQAQDSANSAEESDLSSEAWAVGKKNGVDVPLTDQNYHNNSKYHSETSEAWATGQRNGTDVASPDPNFHNNSKYYSEQSSDFADDSHASAENSQLWATGGSGQQYSVGNSSKEQADRAAMWAVGNSSGDGSATNNAKYWSEQSQTHATDSNDSELNSEAWAVGQKDGVDVPSTDPKYHNNSKYYSEQSSDYADASEISNKNSEAWAVGQRGGVDVASTDPNYQNNAKYYSEQSSDSADSSEVSNQNSEAWAVGKRQNVDVESTDAAYHNNSKYYSEQSSDSAETSESWAVGQKSGVDVPSTDVTYQNNAKYYSDHADAVVADFTSTVTSAATTYQNSRDGSNHPDPATGWSPTPVPVKGMYLWAKTTFTWGDGHTTTMYTCSYCGVDGDNIQVITNAEIDTLFA